MTDIQNISGPTFDAAIAELDRIAASHVENGRAVGLSVAIVLDGRLTLRQYGLANRESEEPVSAQSRFPIGSVSKQFTAAAILALAEDGKLSLDDPVARFFPDLTRASDITVRALLNHTSGYPDWYPLDYLDARKLSPISIEDARKEYGRKPLEFEPGEHYSYSNTGYLIAACIVEQVTGRPFFEFLSTRFLQPLGMTHTKDYRRVDPEMVGRYGRYFAGPIEAMATEADGWLTGAGGLVTTPEDLAKWNTALLSRAIFSDKSWSEMSSPTTLSNGRLSFYGLGLSNGRRHGRALLGHRGGVSGAISESLLVPELALAIAWGCNTETSGVWSITGTILDALIPESLRVEACGPTFGATRTITVAGPPPEYAGAVLFRDIVSGALDRSRLTAECNAYLSEDRLAPHRARLKALGEPITVGVVSTGERSAMQVAELRFEFASGPQRALLGRYADGTVGEFMLQN